MIVLVVDDQEIQLKIVGSQLSHAGYKVILCRSGQEAVDTLNSHTVDIVITDMNMPVMTGEHVLEYVRKEFGSIPVILMSGNPDNLKNKGFDGYLEKPFQMRELLAAVENALK